MVRGSFEGAIKVSRRVISSAASDDASARTQQLEEKAAALEEQLRRSAAVLLSDFSKDSDRVAGLNSTPPSDVSEDGASEQANVDGVMKFSNNEQFDQVCFHFKSDAGSSLANLGEEKLSDIGDLLNLKLEGRRASAMRLAIIRKLTKMGLTGRLGHLLFLRSPAGELIGTARSSTPFVAAMASPSCRTIISF